MTHTSPDGVWRWDGTRWVPNEANGHYQPGPTYGYQPPRPASPLTGAEEVNAAAWSHYGPLIAACVAVLLWLTIIGWSLAWLGIFAFVIPLIIRQTQGQRSRFVMQHATESLNFQLTCLAVSAAVVAVLILPAILTFGIVLMLLVPLAIGYTIFMIVVMAKAGSAAKSGYLYRYPLTFRFVSAG